MSLQLFRTCKCYLAKIVIMMYISISHDASARIADVFLLNCCFMYYECIRPLAAEGILRIVCSRVA